MARKSAVVCAWLCLGSSAGALALGLGDIEIRSALNQPLDAEVELISASSSELEQLEVTLASRETFERLGLERSSFLSGLEFDVARDARGAPVLRVSSDRPVSEPFLTFLIEARWPRGRLLREYTVLIDPPVYLADNAVAPPTRQQARPRQAASGPVTRRAPPAEGAPETSAAGRAGVYGPVAANETLWMIADRLRREAGVSVNQMMIALYRGNPEAFGGNINVLHRGAVLEVPTPRALAELAAPDADRTVDRHNRDWQSGSDGALAERAEPARGRLRLVPPAEDETATGVGAGSSSGQRADGDAEARRSEVAALDARLENAERLLELKNNELAALQERVTALRESSQATPGLVPGAAADADAAGEAVAAGRAVEPGAAGESGEPVAADETVGTEREAVAPAESPARPVPSSIVEPERGALAALFGSAWLYVGLGVLLLVAAMLMFARRRSDAFAPAGRWQALEDHEDERAIPVSEVVTPPGAVEDEEPIPVVEREQPARVREPEPVSTPDEEATLSSATAVQLDQVDPVAEADFHIAYGLYDQAAELVQNASREEPARRDLRMKLLEIYFVWGNAQAFLDEARRLRETMTDETDSDWDRVLILGKQLCPEEPLFAADPGVTGAGAADVDLDLADTGESSIDFETFDEAQGETALDLDLGAEAQADGRTGDTRRIATRRGTEDLLEFELEDDDAPADSVARTPEVSEDSPQESSTVEQPTLEAAQLEHRIAESLTKQRIGPSGSDETAEIDLDDLGLDLDDLRTDDEMPALGDGDETMMAEVAGFDAPETADEDESDDFDATARVLGRNDRHHGAPDRQPEADADPGALDFGLDDALAGRDPDDVTGQTSDTGPTGSESGELDVDLTAIMDESELTAGPGAGFDFDDELEAESAVGTKLDLARAYLDMGDPDGANSILQEVLEEGDAAQREEAQRLKEALPS
ncbi:motility hub landmark protein FimV [soil metagenome]